jgi:hypothetical protein
MRIWTKSHKIPVLMNLIKALAESHSVDECTINASEMKAKWEIYNKVCSISGEVSDHCKPKTTVVLPYTRERT